jgi:hypothetical protein
MLRQTANMKRCRPVAERPGLSARKVTIPRYWRLLYRNEDSGLAQARDQAEVGPCPTLRTEAPA